MSQAAIAAGVLGAIHDLVRALNQRFDVFVRERCAHQPDAHGKRDPFPVMIQRRLLDVLPDAFSHSPCRHFIGGGQQGGKLLAATATNFRAPNRRSKRVVRLLGATRPKHKHWRRRWRRRGLRLRPQAIQVCPSSPDSPAIQTQIRPWFGITNAAWWMTRKGRFERSFLPGAHNPLAAVESRAYYPPGFDPQHPNTT